ncbi:enhancer of polycomb homolog 2 isoform X4 [Mobula birostris]|uniref:enhancer of polycomb homolog 2 isoform X4 n=1 Tax=Mobula birostris TaxID=1983395 RepID=UPI003B27C65B
MSKLSFRARALDAAKPLPIYRAKDLPDLQDCVSINRAVPQMPTGMEKEEESEHHLQRAISAQQVFREKRENMVIPVPEAESNVSYYDRLYRGEFKVPKQLIHIQPINLDSEQPDYDMDSEDEILFNRLNRKVEIKPLQFEEMFDRLEKASGNQLVSIQEAKLLLKEDDYLIKAVHDYWARKRKNCRAPSLIPWVKQEKRDGSTNNDPYVAFRRRTEKMQTRKNRKNDEASYEKMLKLRREFSRAVTILEMIKRREKTKRDLLHLTLGVVEKRYHMGDFGGEVMSELKTLKQEKVVSNTPASLHNGNHYKAPENKIVKQQAPHLMTLKEEVTDAVRVKKKYVKKKHKASECIVLHHQPSTESQPPLKRDIKQYDFLSSDEESYTQVPSPVSETEEDSDPDGLFAFKRKAGCQYYAGSRISDCSSKTLDSASAHFAASAVVSAPGPSQSEVSKDAVAGQTANINGVVQSAGTYKNLQPSNVTSSSSPGLSTVQLIRTVNRTSANHVFPALRTSSPQSFPVNNSCIGTAVRLNSMNVVTPVNVHLSARTSAPSPSALKLATAATSLDRVPKVTPGSAISSLARESSEPERLLNGIADKTVAMEVT